MRIIFLLLLQVTFFTFSQSIAHAGFWGATGDKIASGAGVLAGFPVGTIVGGFRGAATGVKGGTLHMAELLGDKNGSAQRGCGFFLGGFPAGFIGTGIGLVKGAYDGIYYGAKDPFSKKSFSLEGNGLTDYELLADY